MDKIRELKEKLLGLQQKYGIAEKAYDDFMAKFEGDAESFTEEKFAESERLADERDDKDSEIRQVKSEILRLEALDKAKSRKLDRKFAASRRPSEEQKANEAFSVARAFAINMDKKPFDGAEKEVHDETMRTAPAGFSPEGIAAPASYMRITPKQGVADNERRTIMRSLYNVGQRDLNVTTAGDGGNTVATDLLALIPVLMPQPLIRNLGATILGGQTANIDFPRGATRATYAWETEVGTNDETSPTFGLVQMRPKRVGAFAVESKQLVMQSNIAVESYLRNLMSEAIQEALDVAAFNGSGVAPVPEGLENITGVGAITTGGIAGFDEAKSYEFKEALSDALALKGNLAWVMTHAIENALRQEAIDAGSGIRLLGGVAGQQNDKLLTYPTFGSDLLAAGDAIFGNWSELILAQWGGLDFVVNPYSLDTSAQVRLTINSWWDVNVKHAASFAMCTDAV